MDIGRSIRLGSSSRRACKASIPPHGRLDRIAKMYHKGKVESWVRLQFGSGSFEPIEYSWLGFIVCWGSLEPTECSWLEVVAGLWSLELMECSWRLRSAVMRAVCVLHGTAMPHDSPSCARKACQERPRDRAWLRLYGVRVGVGPGSGSGSNAHDHAGRFRVSIW